MTRLPLLAAASLLIASCAPATAPQASEPEPAPAFTLATPEVVMAADPPPPFTYWAPEGSTIRNHPRSPGIWIAEIDGAPDRYYFGDQCLASRYQSFVGQPLDTLPDAPEGAVWRIHCTECAVTSDLNPERMNISFDEDSRLIEAIGCA